MLVEDKTSALYAAAEKEKSLRAEYERIRIENDRLMAKQSQSAAMHREVTNRLYNDLQSMRAYRNELDHELRESKLMIRLEREEYEKHLHIANQCSIALLKSTNTVEEKLELPGHGHAAMMMSKAEH